MEKRKVGIDEVIKEETLHLVRAIKDDKKYLLKEVGKGIADLQKLQSELMTYADNTEYKIPTDLDDSPRIIDMDRLVNYSRKINNRVDRLAVINLIARSLKGDLEV